jgi:YidC/Oxa1 family membrane protein insertase
VFISVFWGMRRMAQLPVESMKYGGILWFTDLTVPDPFYLLPILTASTLLTIVEVGVRVGGGGGRCVCGRGRECVRA